MSLELAQEIMKISRAFLVRTLICDVTRAFSGAVTSVRHKYPWCFVSLTIATRAVVATADAAAAGEAPSAAEPADN